MLKRMYVGLCFYARGTCSHGLLEASKNITGETPLNQILRSSTVKCLHRRIRRDGMPMVCTVRLRVTRCCAMFVRHFHWSQTEQDAPKSRHPLPPALRLIPHHARPRRLLHYTLLISRTSQYPHQNAPSLCHLLPRGAGHRPGLRRRLHCRHHKRMAQQLHEPRTRCTGLPRT